MDAKITLSFDKDVIRKAKEFAKENNISLSRLTEFLLSKTVHSQSIALDKLPVSDWVDMVAESEVAYLRKPRARKEMKQAFFEGNKK